MHLFVPRHARLIWVLLLLVSDHCFAQNNYVVTRYTTDNGLPQNSVKIINFDQAGYCWLGTEMGLVRFDGLNFKVFDLNNVEGLRSNRILALPRDSSGNVYAVLSGGQQLAITVAGSGPAPFPRLLQREEVCFSILNNYAVKPSPSGTGIVEKLNNFINATEYQGMDNMCVATPGNNDLYVVVNRKLFHVDHTSLKPVTPMPIVPERSLVISNDTIILLQPGCRACIVRNGVLLPNILAISGPLSNSKEFKSGNYKIIRSRTGAFLYAGNTLYRLYPGNTQLVSEVLLKESGSQRIDLSDIQTVYYNDEQQKYYIGTLTSGLYVITPTVFRYPHIRGKAIANGFRSEDKAEDGESIICEQYLYRRNGTVKLLPVGPYIGATMYVNPDNVMYYGDAPELYKFDLKAGKKTMLFKLDSRPSGILPDIPGGNDIWIVTSLSVGKLYRNNSRVFKKVPGRKDGAGIWGFTQIGKDSLILTTQQGLKWYDWSRNRIFHSILDSFTIHSVYAESADLLWISTYGKGIFLYHKGKTIPLPSGPTAALKMVHSFVDDGKGYFWLPTNNGLYKVSKAALLAYAAGKSKDVYYYSFSTQNDLRSNEFNGGSIPHYVWFKDSMLSLLSIKGPVWFYPNKINVHYPDKRIYADQLEVDNKTIPYPDNGHISLAPTFGNMILTVSSPYFGNKENLQLKYKVEGISKDWQAVDPSGKIKLNRIPFGNYRLIVRKLNGNNAAPYDSLVLSFTVIPHFYNTWWFYAILAVILAGGTYLSIKLNTRRLIHRNQRLKDIIDIRTEHLNKTIHQLSVSEQYLSESNDMKDNIITMVLHDLRSPIRFLHFISKRTVTGYGQLEREELHKRLTEINTGVAAINDFTERFFAWATSHRTNFQVNKTLVDLQLLFEEIADLYEDIIRLNGNNLQIYRGNYHCYTDKDILSVIIRNLLDNANKNTQNGPIALYASYTQSHVVITISDTGKGITDSEAQAFRDISAKRSNKGYGSMLITDLLEKIEGVLEINSGQGEGTCFNILLARPQMDSDKIP